MTITIEVPEGIARKIKAEADRQGQEIPEVVRTVVESRFAGRILRPYDPDAFTAALDSFSDGDPEEQRTTLEYLKVAIDRDRPGQRSIFGSGTNPIAPQDEIS